MRYQETKQQSNELIRLLIPLMAKHPAASTPVTYTLWYEYLSGVNPGLKVALDELLDSGNLLTDGDAFALFRKHVLRRDDDAQEKFELDFRRLVEGVSDATASASQRAGNFASALEQRGSELANVEDPQASAGIMRAILNDTLQMREAVTALNQELGESLKEVESLRKELERTQSQALLDPMTGVKNRRGLEKVIDAASSSSSSGMEGSCLMMIDIDHFKRLNDAHGHLLGDKVIRTVAQLLLASVKGQDTVARWGGEEFVILLPHTPLAGAKALAETLRATVERGRIRRHGDGEYIDAVTISIGVAAHKDNEPFEDYAQRADLAMYAAKRAGRNRVMAAQ